jgi:hypothetical protein
MRIPAEPAVNQGTVARLLLYRFLAQCYTYPEPAFCEALHGRELWDQLGVAGEALSRRIDQSIASLQACVRCYNGGDENLLTDLQIVSYLVQQEATAAQQAPGEAEAWRTRQRDFLAEHLLRWGPPFLKRVMEHARRPFYIQVSKLTDALFHSEKR